jgi:hypothetical protein
VPWLEREAKSLWGDLQRHNEGVMGSPFGKTPAKPNPEDMRERWNQLKDSWRVLHGPEENNPFMRWPRNPLPGGELGPPYGGPMGNPEWGELDPYIPPWEFGAGGGISGLHGTPGSGVSSNELFGGAGYRPTAGGQNFYNDPNRPGYANRPAPGSTAGVPGPLPGGGFGDNRDPGMQVPMDHHAAGFAAGQALAPQIQEYLTNVIQAHYMNQLGEALKRAGIIE